MYVGSHDLFKIENIKNYSHLLIFFEINGRPLIEANCMFEKNFLISDHLPKNRVDFPPHRQEPRIPERERGGKEREHFESATAGKTATRTAANVCALSHTHTHTRTHSHTEREPGVVNAHACVCVCAKRVVWCVVFALRLPPRPRHCQFHFHARRCTPQYVLTLVCAAIFRVCSARFAIDFLFFFSTKSNESNDHTTVHNCLSNIFIQYALP